MLEGLGDSDAGGPRAWAAGGPQAWAAGGAGLGLYCLNLVVL